MKPIECGIWSVIMLNLCIVTNGNHTYHGGHFVMCTIIDDFFDT